MTVRLSRHLRLRIKVRKIGRSLPRRIIESFQDLYFDKVTQHFIAVKEEKYAGKIRPMVAVFDKRNGDIDIITIYPSDTKEITSRIERRRWIHEEDKS